MNALEVAGLHVSYGESRIIEDVSFRIAERESLALMGRNGMGKTTLLKALLGMLPIRLKLIALNLIVVQIILLLL